MEQPLKASRETAEMLRRMIREEMARAKQRGRVTREHADNFALASFVAKAKGQITARSGTTAGSGTAEIVRITDTIAGTIGDAEAADVEVFNLQRIAIEDGSYIRIAQDAYGAWWVVEGWTTRYEGQLQGAMTSADSTHTVDNLIPLDGPGGLTSVTAHNRHGWPADDNAVVRIEWNQNQSRWEMYQVDCPA